MHSPTRKKKGTGDQTPAKKNYFDEIELSEVQTIPRSKTMIAHLKV